MVRRRITLLASKQCHTVGLRLATSGGMQYRGGMRAHSSTTFRRISRGDRGAAAGQLWSAPAGRLRGPRSPRLFCWRDCWPSPLAAKNRSNDCWPRFRKRWRDLSDARNEQLAEAARAVDEWAAGRNDTASREPAERVLPAVRELITAKQRVDAALEQALNLRTQFASLPDDESRRQQTRRYLRATAQLIDLSGRLRYTLQDAINTAAYRLDPDSPQMAALPDLLTAERVSVGAVSLAYRLFEPPPDSGAVPYSPDEKYKVLNLIARSRQRDLVPHLAEFVRKEKNPRLVVIGTEAIRRAGLPQKPRPGQDPALPPPPILAEELLEILQRIDPAQLYPALEQNRQQLLAWLTERSQRGVLGDSYGWGDISVRAGDWLLMRNPSPYNLFTDLSPGLFTHVGVVGVETGSDGIRRFVIVDLPERGAQIPATTVDVYLQRTLHFVFLRHADPAIGDKMGSAAVELIGNESLFDMSFQTSRVLALAGKPLKGARIHTYCAGLLLLCAQATGAPGADFFPLRERAAGGNTPANLAHAGLVHRPGLRVADRGLVLAADAAGRPPGADVRAGSGSSGGDLRSLRRGADRQDAPAFARFAAGPAGEAGGAVQAPALAGPGAGPLPRGQ